MRIPRLVPLLVLTGLLSGLSAVAPRPAAAQAERCFAETGVCVQGRFLDYWQQHGGLAVNGYPLGAERRELLEDGVEYTVQYFERVRLEYHPEHAAPADVLLGQFGRRILRGAMYPAAPLPGQRFVPETGHNLGGEFLAYWEAHGGLAQFGLPLSEEIGAILEDRGQYTVQYFERARFEHHPEQADPAQRVQLGQFGRRILAENALLGGAFGTLYRTDARVRDFLGPPRGRAAAVPGATQAFEHGRMLYFGGPFLDAQFSIIAEERRIYVLCGAEVAGLIVQDPDRRLPFFPDTWAEGQEPGGGAAPVPNLHMPRRGFGKVWREHPEVRECAGYARTADEQATTLTVQSFAEGLLVASSADAGHFVYALYFRPSGKVSFSTFYERYAVGPAAP